MANTYVLISSLSLSSIASSIGFTSIPSTYSDLKFVFNAKTNGAGARDDFYFTINGATGSGYAGRRVFGIDGNAGSLSAENQSGNAVDIKVGSVNAAGNNGNVTFAPCEFYIPNYANTSYNKSMLCWWAAPNSSTSSYVLGISGASYATTSAISSFYVLSRAGNSFIVGTTAYLYGIKNT